MDTLNTHIHDRSRLTQAI